MKIFLPLLALICPLSAVSCLAETTAYREDFSEYPVGTSSALAAAFFSWSEKPNPMNPGIVEVEGHKSILLNPPGAGPSGSTVVGSRRYFEVGESVTAYGEVTFSTPRQSSVGISITLNRDYTPIIGWQAVLTPDSATGLTVMRLDETDMKTNARHTLTSKSLDVNASGPIPLGLRISLKAGTVEVLIDRKSVARSSLEAKDPASLANTANIGLFGFNGQSVRFDNLVAIVNENVQP